MQVVAGIFTLDDQPRELGLEALFRADDFHLILVAAKPKPDIAVRILDDNAAGFADLFEIGLC